MKKHIIQKLSNSCKNDYNLFKLITCENFRYSALQFLVKNIREIKDINDFEEVSNFFEKEENDKYMRNGYDYLTQNSHLSPIGYQKVFNEEGEIIGIGGHFVDEMKNGKITKLQRGIHIRQDFITDPDNPKPVVRARDVMLQFIEDLEKNKNLLDYDGVFLSSILITNGRMIDFGKKYHLNVGDGVENKEKGTIDYVRKIGDYIEHLPVIKESLSKPSSLVNGINAINFNEKSK